MFKFQIEWITGFDFFDLNPYLILLKQHLPFLKPNQSTLNYDDEKYNSLIYRHQYNGS